jgi:purine-binding chemotaxis protein CheW
VTDAPAGLAGQAAKLRAAFDATYAAPLRRDGATNQDLLAVRAGAAPYAIRFSDISGLFVDRKITRVPANDTSSLLGIAGFRGAIVPVHSLPVILGLPAAHAFRWLVMVATTSVALAFDAFEGHLRVLAASIVSQQLSGAARSFAPEFVHHAGIIRPVLHLPSVIEALGSHRSSHAIHERSEKA